MNTQEWLDDICALYRQYKDMCERAVAQVSDKDFFAPLGENGNSIAIVMKHVGGNNRSRWRNFLTEDGEKPDRNRDREFIVEGDTRASVMAVWEAGWCVALDELDRLKPDDIDRTITIRGEPHTVFRAINRNLAHASYHTGQIVELSRYHAGEAWKTLSVPRGQSDALNAKMRDRFGEWDSKA